MRNITQIFSTKEISMNFSMLRMNFKGRERNEKKRKEKIALMTICPSHLNKRCMWRKKTLRAINYMVEENI
jgi:hypothetical protein